LHAFAIEPLQADFPHARTLIVLRSERTVKKSAATTTESRHYLSSAPPGHYRPEPWQQLIRGHWRRDPLMGEDRSRSRNPNLLANPALIRNALLSVLACHFLNQSLPEIREFLHSRPGNCLNLIAKP
jgi:hypothetical protein